METTRRSFLRLLALGVVGHNLDIDRLLWVPGSKTIFLPSRGISYSSIVAAELDRILPHMRTLFERDDMFYTMLKADKIEQISGRTLTIPLELRGKNE